MIPEFLIPLHQPHTKRELEYLCSFITDWEEMEQRIWLAIFELAISTKIMPISGADRLYFKYFLKTGLAKHRVVEVLEKNSNNPNCLVFSSIAERSFLRMINAFEKHQVALVNDNVMVFMIKCYHVVIKELINRHSDSKELTHEFAIRKHTVYETVVACNQIVQNAWRVDYTILAISHYKLVYKKPTFRFKNDEDLALVKLIL